VNKRHYTLRLATQADCEFLYELKKACLKEYVAATWGWDESYQKSHFSHHFKPANSQIIVVEGYDVGQLSVENHPGEIYIGGIYILPIYQGQGLGTTILRDLIAQARIQQSTIRLQVLRVNPARQLYERLGFRIVAQNETHYQMAIE
jgi:ribosomal protein S18 acetylase RimI-like enzyme